VKKIFKVFGSTKPPLNEGFRKVESDQKDEVEEVLEKKEPIF